MSVPTWWQKKQVIDKLITARMNKDYNTLTYVGHRKYMLHKYTCDGHGWGRMQKAFTAPDVLIMKARLQILFGLTEGEFDESTRE